MLDYITEGAYYVNGVCYLTNVLSLPLLAKLESVESRHLSSHKKCMYLAQFSELYALLKCPRALNKKHHNLRSSLPTPNYLLMFRS